MMNPRIHNTPACIRRHNERGGKANVRLLLIEGKYVTALQVAAKLGYSPSVTRRKMAILRQEKGAITYAKLAAIP